MNSFSDMEIGSGLYLKIDAGEIAQIRILSKSPVKKVVHSEEGKMPIKCIGPMCALCKDGVPVRTRWKANVYNRKTNKVQIFEFGPKIAKQIKNIAKMLEDEGNTVNQIDLRISAIGEGIKKDYTVLTKEGVEDVPDGLQLHDLNEK